MSTPSGYRDLDELFAQLAQSGFRARFKLRGKELSYFRRHGIDKVLEHAADFIAKRLAPARPANDGKQTPMRGHPVFLAQHATGTCCRGCLKKWHYIEKGIELSDEDRRYVLSVIEKWLTDQNLRAPADIEQPTRPRPGNNKLPGF